MDDASKLPEQFVPSRHPETGRFTMSEAVAEIKAGPKEFMQTPWKAITVGIIFLFLVLILEAFKPGLITGPIKSLLAMVGIGTGA